jgi:hypothetical protein
MPIEDAIAKLRQEAGDRVVRQVAKSSLAGLESDAGEANEY